MLLPCSLLLLFLVYSLATSDCGFLGSSLFPTRHPRAIIGGKDIKTEDVPWVVRVDAADMGHICTGTLISDRHVITAAHCFKTQEGCQQRVDREYFICHHENTNNEACSEDRKFLIKSVHLFDDYLSSGCKFSSDLVVAELERSVPNSPKICLPSPSDEVDYEKRNPSHAHALGYSTNNMLGRGVDNTLLQYAKIKVRIELWGEDDTAKDRFLVSDADFFGSPAICEGDSGGPMFEIHNNTALLVGVNVGSEGICHVRTVVPVWSRNIQVAVEVKPYLEKINAVITQS